MMSSGGVTVVKSLSALAGFLYGFVYLCIALVYSLIQKEFWLGQTEDEQKLLDKASQDLWSLSQPPNGLSHNFLDLLGGIRLHYLSTAQSSRNPDTLILLLHGFPDSAHLFSHQLRSFWPSNAKFVALDLPGCGGSDSIPRYGPDQVLNIIAEAIIALKARYVAGKGRCVFVGHDWGAVIGFRLAAESKGLIDHLVALNSLWPAYAEMKLKAIVSQSRQLWPAGRYREAASILGPVLSQLGKSSYTYMVTLPFPLAKWMPRLTSSLLRVAHGLQYRQFQHPSPEAVANRLAIAYGPSTRECESCNRGPGYSKSVLIRSKTSPPGDWDQRVKLYAQGLLREDWTPFAGLAQSGVEQKPAFTRFNCPVNIIFGLQDVALDSRIAVDGIEKYFCEAAVDVGVARGTGQSIGSSVVKLQNCGHWSVIEEDGRRALEELLTSLLQSQN